jgi:hypothetical protein
MIPLAITVGVFIAINVIAATTPDILTTADTAKELLPAMFVVAILAGGLFWLATRDSRDWAKIK